MDTLARAVEGALPEDAELVEARFSGGPLLTLLVDRDGGPVDHEFCTRVISQVSPALEEAGYGGMIEVSSPGIERPLTRPEHFRRFVGHEVRVRVVEPVEGRRNFSGVIGSAGERDFVIQLLEGGAAVELPYGSVTRAQLKEDI